MEDCTRPLNLICVVSAQFGSLMKLRPPFDLISCSIIFACLSFLAAPALATENSNSEKIAPTVPFPRWNSVAGGIRVQDPSPILRSTVALRAYDANGSIELCSGTLISDDLIITAAHCLYGAISVKVSFGMELNTPAFEAWASVASYPQNSNPFVAKDRLDLGLVQLRKAPPSTFSKAVLLSDNVLLNKGTSVTIAGYGSTDMAGSNSGILRQGELLVADERYSATEILLTQSPSAACPGDSGGPAFVKKDEQYFLLGVANGGLGESKPCGAAAVYADLRAKENQEHLSEVVIALQPGS